MIELGGGTNPHPRADAVIDLHHPLNAPPQDATVTPWDYLRSPSMLMVIPDETADEVFCSHFLEHIPAGQPRLDVMNEAWRVLKPGGSFTIVVPLIGYTDPETGAPKSDQVGWQPWADPTHVSQWWFPESLWYFTEPHFRPHADYGYKAWTPGCKYVDQDAATALLADYRERHAFLPDTWWSVRDGWEGVARLVKKP